MLRKRRIGWDGARQRAFVAWLAHTPSIGFAARKVGMSAQSAYRLFERPGAAHLRAVAPAGAFVGG